MKLKNRTIVSLIILIAFFSVSIYAFISISNGEKSEYTPKILRTSLLYNEAFWSKFYSARKLSLETTPPPVGKIPRVNGVIGLEKEADATNYQVIIETPEKSFSLPLSAFYSTPKTGYSTEFRCIEGWSENMQFAGARFSDFMEFYKVGKKADGTFYNYVGFETPDRKYYVSIDMESMLHPQTLLAYEMNHEKLRMKNGAPLRLAIPIKYGFKSLKRVGKIFFSDTRPPDYWVEYGYDWYAAL